MEKMEKQHQKVQRDSGEIKQHYKMYKSSKGWLFAVISLITFGTGVTFAQTNVQADDNSAVDQSTVVNSTTSDVSKDTAILPVSGASTNTVTNGSNNTDQDITAAEAAGSEGHSDDNVSGSNVVASSSTASKAAASTTVQSSATSSAVSESTTATSSSATPLAMVAPMVATAVASSSTDTGTLNGKNPADYDENGTYIGDSATSTVNTSQEVHDSFSTTGSATVNGDTVTLINGYGQNGSYVFNNQVDTTKGFTIQGSFTSSAKDAGGGYGIILQPTNPQEAGVNTTTSTLDGSSTYSLGQADVGIEGLPNTTFVGRDFYPISSKGDTLWNAIAVRQTDANGNMVTTNVSSTMAGTGQTNAIIKGEYYTLTWIPNTNQGTTSKGYVSGTLVFTTYSNADRTTQVQTLTTSNVIVSQAVSLAAFAASGGNPSTDTASVSSFTGTRVTMPVTVHYVDQSGKSVASDDKITVNVGSTFAVGSTTDVGNNVYASKAVSGYEYAAATDEVTVSNTNITPGANNEVTVTYLKVTGTQTVGFANVPSGASGNFTTRTQTATEASTKAETAAAAHGYSTVVIPQIAGYTSFVSKDGATAVAATSIAAKAPGATDESYVVTYVAQAKLAINYQDYFGNTIHTSGSYTGNVGDMWNATTSVDAVAVNGYAFSATDAKNNPATNITFSQDSNGNTVAKDKNGNVITSVTLYYKTNVSVTITATKVYDGLDNDGQTAGSGETGNETADEPDDYLHLTFTDQNGKVLTLNGIANAYQDGQFYYTIPDAGTYPGGVLASSPRIISTLKAANPAYNFSSTSFTSSVDYVITKAPITATISSDSSATKAYDGKTISYVPTVTYSGVSGAMIAPSITWVASDFEYLDSDNNVVSNPTNAGTYKIQFSTSGQNKLNAQNNYTITNTSVGTYTITPANISINVNSSSKDYGTADPTPAFTLATGTLGTGDTLANLGFTYTRATGETVGSYTITGKITNANYKLTGLANNAFIINQAPATVKNDNQTMVAGGDNPTLTSTVVRNDGLTSLVTGTTQPATGTMANSDYVVSDTNGNTVNLATALPGTYTIKLTNTALDTMKNANPNYALVAVAGVLTITAAAAKAVIVPGSKEYDGRAISDTPAVTISLVGGTNTSIKPVQVTLAKGDYTITGTDSKLINAGTYTIKLTQAGIDRIQTANPMMSFTDLSNVIGTYTVTQKKATITVTPGQGKIFGASDPGSFEVTTSTLVGNDQLEYSTERTDGETVGSYPITIILDDNPNYDITTIDGSFTITTATVSAIVSSGSKVYDGKTISNEFTPTVTLDRTDGGTGLPEIKWEATDFTYTDSQNVGDYPIQLSDQGKAKLAALTNYSFKTTVGTYTITKRPVNVSAGDYTKVYGEADPAYLGSVATGLVSGDTLDYDVVRNASTTVNGVLHDNNDSEAVGTYILDVNMGTNPNYAVNSTTGTLTITAQSATAEIIGSSKTYDGKNISDLPTVILTGSNNNVISSLVTWTVDDFEYVQGDTVTTTNKDVGDYTIQFSAAGLAKLNSLKDFDFTAKKAITNGTYTINKRDATITVTGGTFNYDGKQHDPKPTVKGTVDGEILNYTLTTGLIDVGTKTVTATYAADDSINKNYNIIVAEDTLTVTAIAATVTLTGGSKTYDGQAIEVGPTVMLTSSVATNSPVDVTLDSDDYTVTKDDGTSDLKGAGTYTYHLTQAGMNKITAASGNYVLGDMSGLTASYTINKKDITLTANDTGKVFGSKDPKLTATGDGVVDGDTINYTISRDAGENFGTYKITVTAGENANYNVKGTADGTFTISRSQVTSIAIDGGEKTYDGDPISFYPHVTATMVDGSQVKLIWPGGAEVGSNGDYSYLPLTGGTDDLTGVGTYTVTISPAGMAELSSANTNYYLTDILKAQSNYTIKQATATITINGGSKVYDGQTIKYVPTVSLTGTADGVKVPTDITLSNEDYTITSVSGSDDLQDAGQYKITLTDQGVAKITGSFSNFDIGNIAADSTTYEITKRPATIIVVGETHEYDGKEHNLSATFENVVDGETLDYELSSGMTYPGTKTVTATYDPSANVNKNYDITVEDAALTITGETFTTITRTVHYEGGGVNKPKDVVQTISYSVTSDDTNTKYTLVNTSPSANIPLITGYTPEISGQKVALNEDGTAYVPIENGDAPATSVNTVPVADNVTVLYTANEEPVLVNATGNKETTGFTYTVNGGTPQTGQYGTELTGIHYDDTVVVAPSGQDGYDVSIQPTILTVGDSLTDNTINVAYTANTQYVNVRYVVEKGQQEVELGHIQLSGTTDEDYTIPTPTESMSVNFHEGMGAEGLDGKVWNTNVPILELDSSKLPNLNGTYTAGTGIPTITIYYQAQDYTLDTEFFVKTGDSYKSVGTGTVSYDYDPDTTSENISYVVPAGYDTTPVGSLIYYMIDDYYMSTGTADEGISVIGDYGFNVDGNGVVSLNVSDVFEPYFVVTPLAQTVTVTATGNSTDNTTFTYTVNGGEPQTGTYGVAISGIVTGDEIVVTPATQDGYGFTQSSATVTASADTTQNTDTVTYSPIKIGDVTITYGEQPTYELTVQTDSGIKTVTLTAEEVDVTNPGYTDGRYLAAGEHTITLNEKGLSVLTTANPGYTFGAITGTVTVDQKQVTLTVDAGQTKVYGNPDPKLTASLTDGLLVGTDTLSYMVSRQKGENVGEYAISIQLGHNGNYLIVPVAGQFKITPLKTTADDKATQVTTADRTIIYGDTTPVLGLADLNNDSNLTLTGIDLTNEDFEFFSADGTTKLDGIPTNVGTYKVNLNTAGQAKVQAKNPNYTMSSTDFIAGTYTINPLKTTAGDKATQVTTADRTIIYGEITPVLGLADLSSDSNLTLTGIDLTNENFEFFSADGTTKLDGIPTNVGMYKVNLNVAGQAKVQAKNPNYAMSIGDFIAGNYVIKPLETMPNDKTTQVTTADQLIIYGEATPAFGLVNLGVGGKLTLDGVELTNSDFDFYSADGATKLDTIPTDVGTYKVNLNTAGQRKVQEQNPNYTMSSDDFIAGTYVIDPLVTNPADETTQVKVNASNITYGETPDFSISAGDNLNIDGVELDADDYTIAKAKYTNYGKYLAADEYQVTLNAQGVAKLQNANPNYTISPNSVISATFKVVAKQITVTAGSDNKVYGTTDPILTSTVEDSLVGTDTLSYTVDRESGENAGTYLETITLGDNENYSITTSEGKFTIKPATTDPADVSTQVKVSAPSITYGDAPSFSISVGDNLTTAGVELDVSDYTITKPMYTNDGKYLAAGEYQVTLNDKGLSKLQQANPNYTISPDSVIGTTLVVAAKKITVTAGSDNKVYGTTDPTLTSTVGEGVLGTDTVNYTVGREAGENVGNYTTKVSVGRNDNYVIMPVDGKFTIKPLITDPADEATQVKVSAPSTTYGDAPSFSVSVGDNLTAAGVEFDASDYTIDNPSYTNNGKYLAAGEYQVTLNDKGLAKLQQANPNYTISPDSVIGTTLVVIPKEITVTAGSDNKVYGTTDKMLTSMVGEGVLGTDTLNYTVTRGVGEDVGKYDTKVIVGHNANYVIVPLAGKFTITPATTDPADESTQIKVSAPDITYGENPSFSINAGNSLMTGGVKLDVSDYTITNPSYTNDGKYLAAGEYQVTLNASGLAKLQAVNPNYTISSNSVISTTLVVNKKAITVTANDNSKVYGTTDPSLATTVGAGVLGNDKLNYTIDREAGEAAGSYVVNVKAGENANYEVIPVTGNFVIMPAATNSNDETTKIIVNDVIGNYGDPAPVFTITPGENVNNPGNLTNNDFTFVDVKTGKPVSGIPTAVGHYKIQLNQSGKNKITDANPNYQFSEDDFVSGTYVINDVIVHSEVTVNRTIHYQGAGLRTPADIVQTIVYDVATSRASGQVTYTPKGSYGVVITPEITGFSNSGNIAALDPETVNSRPNDTTVTVHYTPTNEIEYGEITVIRTIHYQGAGSKTPQDVIETVIYKVAINKTTGETVYTPQGIYDAVTTPEIEGYTSNGDVAKLIPAATMIQPTDINVTIDYSPISNPGNGGSENGNGVNNGNGGDNGNSNSGNSSSGNNGENGSSHVNSGGPTTGNSSEGHSQDQHFVGGSEGQLSGNITKTSTETGENEATITANNNQDGQSNKADQPQQRLPQTDSSDGRQSALIGMVLLTSLFGLLGLKRWKKDDEQ